MKRKICGLRRNQQLHTNNAGSTMVEVIVGFVILVMVLMECMVHLLGVSGNLVAKSKDMQEDQRIMNEEMYQKNTQFDKVDGVNITLSLDSDKTKSENLAASTTLPLSAELKRYYSSRADLTVFRLIRKEP